MHVQPYLFLEGRAQEAVEFYQRKIGAEVVALMRYADAPPPPAGQQAPEGCAQQMPAPDKVMHGELRIGTSTILFSDGMASGNPKFEGFSLTIATDTDADAARLFDALAAEGGQVRMPLGPTFFASSFGMLADKFGVGWMIIKRLPTPAR